MWIFGLHLQLVQEYLANVAQRTIPPSTFDMRQLMAQMPAIMGSQQQIVAKSSPLMELEKSWAEVGERKFEIDYAIILGHKIVIELKNVY